MPKIGLLQPGRLGDIIICLPIAKYYTDRGFEVVWPMFESISNMVKESINFDLSITPINENVYTAIYDAKEVFKNKNVKEIIDIAATFPGSNSTEEYVKCGDGLGEESFDVFKYRLAKVPINEKWNLPLKRNSEKEIELYNSYVKTNDYVVTSLSHSKGAVNLKLDTNGKEIINMNINHNIFHWLKILENAKGIVCVESSVSNLIEQCNISCKKILIKKPDGRLPLLRNNWKII